MNNIDLDTAAIFSEEDEEIITAIIDNAFASGKFARDIASTLTRILQKCKDKSAKSRAKKAARATALHKVLDAYREYLSLYDIPTQDFDDKDVEELLDNFDELLGVVSKESSASGDAIEDFLNKYVR